MLKKIALSVVLVGFMTLPILAEEVRESIISTEATVNREVDPDTAKVSFYVENSGINLKDLKEKNDKIVKEAISAIKAQLNSDEKIKTIAFSVRNVYSYKDKVRIFQKYEVRNGFEVKLKDINKVSEIINIAMDNGVKNVGNINFSIENSQNVCNEMIADSVKIAKNRAQILSAAAGASLDKVKSINPYCSLSANYVQPRMNKIYMANSAMDSASGAVAESIDTIEPGVINARASVNMVYYLK